MQNLSFAPPPRGLSVPMPVSVYGGSRSHLPNRLAPGEWDRPRAVPPSANAAPAQTVHWILWIDDEVESGDALLRLCALEGFRVDVAGSGAEGLGTASARRYDAIIVDLHLPDMFGLTVLQRLRASGVTAPVLAVSGHYLEPEIKTSALRSGATAFCYKPLDSDEIVAVLRSMIVAAAARRSPCNDLAQPMAIRDRGCQSCDAANRGVDSSRWPDAR